MESLVFEACSRSCFPVLEVCFPSDVGLETALKIAFFLDVI